MTLRRPTALVIHDDGDILDRMIRIFEASGFDVVTAVTGFRAQQHLESERHIDVVVAPWDLGRTLGGDVYRWCLQQRYDLRDQFVFLSNDLPPEFDAIVAGRCVAVSGTNAIEVVRCAVAAVRLRVRLEAARDAATAVLDGSRPTLLLAEDDPALLDAMAAHLGDSYTVLRVDSGNSAIAFLAHGDPDAIVIDWAMDDGSGADVFRWIETYKPALARRVVFLGGQATDDPSIVAPGRPIFAKGQDSPALVAVLHEIVRQVRAELSDPAARTGS